MSYINFGSSTYFTEVDFNKYVSFHKSEFDQLVDFRKVTFFGKARFMKSEFNNKTFFNRAIFTDTADFRHASFYGSSQFKECGFQADPIMKDAFFADVIFHNIKTLSSGVTLHLELTEIKGGEITQETTEEVYYNLRDSCIGDIDIKMPISEQIFERLFIYRTDFDGFDFSTHRYVLEPNWVLHKFTGESEYSNDIEADHFFAQNNSDVDIKKSNEDETVKETTEQPISTSRPLNWFLNPEARNLEVTYLKAKNGAEKSGDSQSASQFFIKEMMYRRQRHLHRIFGHHDSLLTKFKLSFLATTNLIFSLTCGYGEKPRRTLISSIVIIVVYAILFSSIVSNPPFNSSLGYLLLSVQSFTSLIVGPSASGTGFIDGFVIASEGFVGAFMIGLFIFALTRSVHR